MNYTRTEKITPPDFELINYLPEIGIGNVREEILSGLRSNPKYISPKFFYDEKGSELFEQITQLEEYYLTRTEKNIISSMMKKLDIDPEGLNIIEFGSGDASKISLLLDQIPCNLIKTINYYPVDISRSAISKSAGELVNRFSLNSVTGIVADFFYQLNLMPKKGKRMFCFFGSTIGNFSPLETEKFMKHLGDTMQKGDCLLLGMDMIKEVSVLNKAYNDKKGITAEFNKNILNVINSLAGTDFSSSNYEHLAFFNEKKNRIEMHLRSKQKDTVHLSKGRETFTVEKGETIHTENSYKFTAADIKTFGIWAGLEVKQILSDENNWFAIAHYIKH